MKICHWTKFMESGSGRVPLMLSVKERALGLDSIVCSSEQSPEESYDADVHVIHSFYPHHLKQHLKPHKTVAVQHATPEHILTSSVNAGTGYGFNDGWAQAIYWLKTADAFVTFWPRHHEIWQSMMPKERQIKLVTLGIDKEFWKKTPSTGKWSGVPSVLDCDAWYQVKWPLDLLFVWKKIVAEVPRAVFHATGIYPHLQRWFFPLVYMNESLFSSHITSAFFSDKDLLNAYNSVDFIIGLGDKGDFNLVSLEANACGLNTISYKGNPYSMFWLDEGDEREMAKGLIAILKGEVEPRVKDEVPDIAQTAKEMKEIYENL